MTRRLDISLLRLVNGEAFVLSDFVGSVKKLFSHLSQVDHEVCLETENAVFPVDLSAALLRGAIEIIQISCKKEGG